MFPDPADCRYFYQCAAGTEYRFECPSGLLFRAEALVCDWAENVDCGPKTTSSGSKTTSTTTKTTSIRFPTTPTTTKTTSIRFPTTRRPTTARRTTATTRAPTTARRTTTTTTVTPTPTASPSRECGTQTTEPITEEIKELRKSTCMTSDQEVDAVMPGSVSNPANVKIVESLLSNKKFRELFPRADPAYTYTNLLKAFAKFPALCTNQQICRKTLATMFAHFQQETDGLFYLNEINRNVYCSAWSDWVAAAYPCTSGKRYFGRGAKQLSWNYNYGAFSTAMFGEAKVLLENPELVSNTWLNFASALWFFVTPQPPKPSMQAVLDGSWTPNSNDRQANRVQGFGTTTMIINGEKECGPSPPNQNASPNRQNYYRLYADMFKVDIRGEKLDCVDMKAFDGSGSFNPSIYWAPESGCSLVNWQTAYSALTEGNYRNCKRAAQKLSP